jgi:hypothetical protein
MVLSSTNPENSILMVQCMDMAVEWFAIRINVTKTKVMLMGKGDHIYQSPSPLVGAM